MIEFRDGPHPVPPHLEPLFAKIETYRMTYDEALAVVNAAMLREHLAKVQADTISEHLRKFGNG